MILDPTGKPIVSQEAKAAAAEQADVRQMVLERFRPFTKLTVSLAPAKHQKEFRAMVEKYIITRTQDEVIALFKHVMYPPGHLGKSRIRPAAIKLARQLMDQYTEHLNKANLLLPTKGQIVCVK